MKYAKKLAGLFLALVMVVSMAAVTFATQPESVGTITITHTTQGQDYTAYKLLDLDGYDLTAQAYVYKVNAKWAPFFETADAKLYINIAVDGVATWVGENTPSRISAFSMAAITYAKQNGIAPEKMITAESDRVVFADMSLGYYLIDSTVGTLCSITTNAPNRVIVAKNSATTGEKAVQEDSTGAYGDENDADISQEVNFVYSISAAAGAVKYAYHDEMSAGLTFLPDSVRVNLNQTQDLQEGHDYVVLTDMADDTDGVMKVTDTFCIKFMEERCKTLTSADYIYIMYSAKLNENAVVGEQGNPNKGYLSYGDKGDMETVVTDTNTYTYPLYIEKFTNGQSGRILLPGAEFILYKKEKNDQGQEITKYALVDETTNKITGWTEDPEQATDVVTDDNGIAAFLGLDADIYWIKETKAPGGYNMRHEPVQVIILSSFTTSGKGVTVTVTYNEGQAAEDNKVLFLNNKGNELPATGGIGTTIFYVTGFVLVAAAVILLVTKKRLSAQQ